MTKTKTAPMTAAEMAARMSEIGTELASRLVHPNPGPLLAERDALRVAYRAALKAEGTSGPQVDPAAAHAVADLLERIEGLAGPLCEALAELEPRIRETPGMTTTRVQRLMLVRHLLTV